MIKKSKTISIMLVCRNDYKENKTSGNKRQINIVDKMKKDCIIRRFKSITKRIQMRRFVFT